MLVVLAGSGTTCRSWATCTLHARAPSPLPATTACNTPPACPPACLPACLQGVSEEVRLIKWPSPGKAALNTLLVIGIVAGTAGLLLAINGALTELSTVLY